MRAAADATAADLESSHASEVSTAARPANVTQQLADVTKQLADLEAAHAQLQSESISMCVARIGCELVTIDDRGESIAIECGRICVGVGEMDKQRSWRGRR
jgi:hypothetical protein